MLKKRGNFFFYLVRKKLKDRVSEKKNEQVRRPCLKKKEKKRYIYRSTTKRGAACERKN